MSMTPIRSFMFVPGHRQKFIDGLPKAEADAVILDLEDSVPASEKVAARALSASKIGWLAEHGRRVYVRANKSAHLYDYDDLMAVVRPGLEGICLSMPMGPEDVALCAAIVAEAEDRNGVASGSVRLLPALETPRSLQLAYEIAQHPRVDYLIGAFAKGADLAGAMGMEWSAAGTEALYLKSRVVMAARPGYRRRSEEHTSQLQSLMRISYAVFCLKKKKTHQLQSAHLSQHSQTDQGY